MLVAPQFLLDHIDRKEVELRGIRRGEPRHEVARSWPTVEVLGGLAIHQNDILQFVFHVGCSFSSDGGTTVGLLSGLLQRRCKALQETR